MKAKKAKRSLKVVAKVTLHEPAKMSKAYRRKIAHWLRGRADLLLKDGDLMASCFRATYYS